MFHYFSKSVGHPVLHHSIRPKNRFSGDGIQHTGNCQGVVDQNHRGPRPQVCDTDEFSSPPVWRGGWGWVRASWGREFGISDFGDTRSVKKGFLTSLAGKPHRGLQKRARCKREEKFFACGAIHWCFCLSESHSTRVSLQNLPENIPGITAIAA